MTENDRNAFNRTSSNKAGVTLMNNQVGHVVADVMRQHDNVKVEELPSMIRVDGTGQFGIALNAYVASDRSTKGPSPPSRLR